ncbi:MAG: T9SS type A sorting domain-containing protein [Saprospiraceae bacterium]|nr:T9SS type A sorting domain-containing protein [Saprospiraceae bacterium]
MVRTLRKGSFFSRGDHAVHLSTNNLSKGIYFVKLVTGANQISKPLILVE